MITSNHGPSLQFVQLQDASSIFQIEEKKQYQLVFCVF